MTEIKVLGKRRKQRNRIHNIAAQINGKDIEQLTLQEVRGLLAVLLAKAGLVDEDGKVHIPSILFDEDERIVQL